MDKNGNHLSAWTIQTEAAALNKLFQIDRADPGRFESPTRTRGEIKRSRIAVEQDKHFSLTNNDELIRFCRGTGCRRNILEKLEGRDLWSREQMVERVHKLENQTTLSPKEAAHLKTLMDALNVFPDQDYFIHHRKDKNGRYRFAPIFGTDKDQIIDRMRRTGDHNKVWLFINHNVDVHGYRAEYAAAVYKRYARNIADIPYDKVNRGSGHRFQGDVYACRGDEKGKKLDRTAMKKASKALGHNRVSVVADNYLYGI